MKITPAQLDFYERNGFLVVEDLISTKNLEILSRRIDEIQQGVLQAQESAKGGQPVGFLIEKQSDGLAVTAKPAVRKLTNLAFVDDFFKSIAASPNILDIVSQLTGGGTELMLYSDQAFLKPAFCGSAKPLHQDNSYFKVTPNSAGVTCWLAIDNATVENGCLNYIPGTHKLGLVKHKATDDPAHLVPDVDFKLGVEIPLPIPAGSCLFHHLLVMHSSKVNSSPKSRRAWALHYANRTAEKSVKSWENMLKLR